MDVIPLLLPLFVVPGWSALTPFDLAYEDGLWLSDRRIGTGREIKNGDVVTVHYALAQSGGKELANTVRRGLPFSFRIGGTDEPPLLVQAVEGMRCGGTRVILLPGDRLSSSGGLPVLRGSDLVLTVRLVNAKGIQEAKVDSNDGGRTEGALEIPRAPVRHGPTGP